MIDHWLDKQQLLIYDSFYPSTGYGATDIFSKMMFSSAAYPETYPPMPFHHKEIPNIAEWLYDQLLRVAVNDTIYPSSHQANQQPNIIKTKN